MSQPLLVGIDCGSQSAKVVVVDASGHIVWVAGHGIDEAFRVTDPSKAVLLLTFTLVGGST